MSNLISISKLGAAETLDNLWSDARSLGNIKVDSSGWSRDGEYEVQITFFRKSCTRVHAVGKNRSIHFALADAINEAREMGAGDAP